MANSAFDETDETAAAKPPLSTHRAFPAIVALWFAVLLGLGSLVLPAALFERPLAAAGLASLVPLGVAARGLIAVAAALAGSWAGLALARRVAATPARRPAATASPRRPFRVRDELDADGPAEDQPQPATRRRARAIVAGDPPADVPAGAGDEGPAEAWPGEDPWPEAAASEEDGEAADREPFEPFHDGAAPDGEARHDPEPVASAPLAAAPADSEIAAPAPEQPGSEAGSFRGDWTTLPLEQLGLVHLLERLGASLERRRQRLARSAPAAAVPAPPAPPGIDPAPADEAAQAMAAYFGRSFAPAGDAEEGAGDPLASLSLPTRDPPARPSASQDAGSDDADGDSFGSLLAMRGPFAVKPGDRPPEGEPAGAADTGAQRLFDPPGAPQRRSAPPAHAQAAETDARLRAALSTLQRMRGAA